MPVNRGSSDKARNENIRAEIHAGKPIKQAVAIGYSEQREARKHMAKREGKGKVYGHHGDHSAGMGTDGGADGSHEHTRAGGHRTAIHTGHPDELEAYHKGEKGAARGMP